MVELIKVLVDIKDIEDIMGMMEQLLMRQLGQHIMEHIMERMSQGQFRLVKPH